MRRDAGPRHEHSCPSCRHTWTCYRKHLVDSKDVPFLEECPTCFVVRIGRIELRLRRKGIEAYAQEIDD